MRTFLASTIIASGLLGLTGPAMAAECGRVSIAEMKWASAGLAANVDKIILESGFGCHVDLVAGDTLPTFTSMIAKGEPDVAPEMWINAVRDPLEKAIADDKIVKVSQILTDGGVEGWWIPKFIADAHPDIKTVEDALKHPELFPAPDDASKGAITNCPAGWGCQITTANLFKATKAAEKGFQLVESRSAADLDDTIAKAFDHKTGWLGYYWAPTAILGQYDMVKLSFDIRFDKTEWDKCIVVVDCPDPRPNSYPVADVETIVTRQFADRAEVVMGYLKARSWDNATVGKVLAWMSDNQASNADSAKYFLKTFPDIWKKWVAPEMAEKIKAEL